ncbi:MAG: ATP-binding cassette domain-containing protein [Desulfobacterales bacterium]
MISVDNLSKSFGASVLFENACFKINRRERVGLVGRNGHSKTTLFRILSGQEEADSGHIAIPKNYRIGYVKQTIDFTEKTVFDEGVRGLPENETAHHWKVEKFWQGSVFPQKISNAPAGSFRQVSGPVESYQRNFSPNRTCCFLMNPPIIWTSPLSAGLSAFYPNGPGKYLLLPMTAGSWIP